MDLKLKRLDCAEDGIFSELCDMEGKVLFRTCEHSYNDKPKVYTGTFKCVRGVHQLHTGPKFETFEITGVSGHSNILFHVGNWQHDSEGCVLVGEAICESRQGRMVTNSRHAFEEFMKLQDGVNEFTLTVE